MWEIGTLVCWATDKLVQEALKEILEAVFEPYFYDKMMGFRPDRSCHMEIRKHYRFGEGDVESRNHGRFPVKTMEEGSSQGAVCSPVIANLYLHYVLGWWFNEQVKPHMRGCCGLVVHANDFVACFQYRKEAFYEHLKKRSGAL